MSSLETVYRHHHESGNRYGLTIFKGVRGNFLAERIGTGKKVLDIGCRDGMLTATYCEGNEVLGVDIDTKALETAKKNLGIETMHFDLSGDWPLEANSFDVVVAGEVIEHVYFPNKVLDKAARVLKPEGVLLGTVPNAFTLKNRIRLFLGRKKNTPLQDPTHINHFSRREMEGLLRQRFREVRFLPFGRFAFLDAFFPGLFSFLLIFEARGPIKTAQ